MWALPMWGNAMCFECSFPHLCGSQFSFSTCPTLFLNTLGTVTFFTPGCGCFWGAFGVTRPLSCLFLSRSKPVKRLCFVSLVKKTKERDIHCRFKSCRNKILSVLKDRFSVPSRVPPRFDNWVICVPSPSHKYFHPIKFKTIINSKELWSKNSYPRTSIPYEYLS